MVVYGTVGDGSLFLSVSLSLCISVLPGSNVGDGRGVWYSRGWWSLSLCALVGCLTVMYEMEVYGTVGDGSLSLPLSFSVSA